MINHNFNLKNKDMKKTVLHFLAAFIFCFSFCLGAENNYTEKNNLPETTPHFLFSHFIPPGFGLFSPNYQFISDFIAAEGEDNVRRIGPDDKNMDYQDGNELIPSHQDIMDSSLDIVRYNRRDLGILNPNTSTAANYQWASAWFRDNTELGVNQIQIGFPPDPNRPWGGATYRNYVLVEQNPLIPGRPSFLAFFLPDPFGNTIPGPRPVPVFYGPVNNDRNSPQYGHAPLIGALFGGHTIQPYTDFNLAIRPIDIDFYNRQNLVLVMDRNGISFGTGFEGNTPGSMNRQIYYWGYRYTNIVNNIINALELALMSGIAQACTNTDILIPTCQGGSRNDIMVMSNLNLIGRPFEMNQYPNGVPSDQTNIYGFRYLITFRIIHGYPVLTLHWENHSYQMQGEFIMHGFFEQNNRHPRKLSEWIDFINGEPTAIENDHIKATENLHLHRMLFSEDESKVLIPAKEGMHILDIPKGSSEKKLLQKITH
jgi:hypothetical protein